MSTAAASSSSNSAAAATSSSDDTIEGSVRLLTLQSEDGEVFEVKKTITTQSVTIKGIVNDDCPSSTIPICKVTNRTLVMVIEWWNKHDIGAISDEKELKEWESQFVIIDDKSDRDDVYNLLIAANYLNIPGLLERCACGVAEAVKGKSTEEIDTVRIFMQAMCGGLLLVRLTKFDHVEGWVVSIVDRSSQNKLECDW